jgi:hypothetical protein
MRKTEYLELINQLWEALHNDGVYGYDWILDKLTKGLDELETEQ